MGESNSREQVVKKADRALDLVVKAVLARRYHNPFGWKSVCPVLCVLLLGSLLGGLLVRTSGALSPGDLQDARQYSTPALVCWSLVLTGIAGTALAAHGVSWGWLILFGLQPLWVAYAITTGQHGLIPGALACGIAHLNGFFRTGAPLNARASDRRAVLNGTAVTGNGEIKETQRRGGCK